MIEKKVVRFTDEQLAKMEPAPEEGCLVTCPACLNQHPLVYETDQRPLRKAWGFVECDGNFVLAAVKGKLIGDTLLGISDEYW